MVPLVLDTITTADAKNRRIKFPKSKDQITSKDQIFLKYRVKLTCLTTV